MAKRTFQVSMLLALLLAFTGGCFYDNLAELHPDLSCDTTTPVSFSNDIVPILTGSCSSLSASCHGPGNFNNAFLDTYDGVKTEVDNGKLISSITWDGVATQSRMPSGSSNKIEDCSISKIERWIAEGAPNN